MRPRSPQALASVPNVITLVRLAVSLLFFALAAVKARELYNFIGLAVHWGGDAFDGWFARTFKQETILGAEIDIIADRIEALFFFFNFIRFHPALVLPAMVYILNFAFADFYLSYQFVKYDIISINYFDRVDRRVYDLNFSPLGKFINSAPCILILIFLPGLWVVALIMAMALIVVKVYSATLLWKKGRAGTPSTP